MARDLVYLEVGDRTRGDEVASPPQGERVKIEVCDWIAEVTLNRPDKLNALDPAMFEAIIAAGERLRQTMGLRAVVLADAGNGFDRSDPRGCPWRRLLD